MRRLLRWLKSLWPWRRHRPELPAQAQPTTTEATAWLPPPVLHLVTHPENRPLCGASIRLPWTEDPAAATCPDCRKEGDLLSVQYGVSTR